MQNQVKVQKTEVYTDAQGSHAVCKGKLKLIYNDIFPEIGMIGSNKVHPLFMWTQQHVTNFQLLPEYLKTIMVLPVIISETEEIKVGDKVLFNGKITDVTADFYTVCKSFIDNHRDCYKILAMGKQFSGKQLRAIIDGKLKDGTEVYIKCEKCIDGFSYEAPYAMFVNLNSYDNIKLFTVKNIFSDIEKEAIKRFEMGEQFHVSEFIDEDTIIAGYGNLDVDFEYPLPAVYIKQIFGTTSKKEYAT